MIRATSFPRLFRLRPPRPFGAAARHRPRGQALAIASGQHRADVSRGARPGKAFPGLHARIGAIATVISKGTSLIGKLWHVPYCLPSRLILPVFGDQFLVCFFVNMFCSKRALSNPFASELPI